MDELDVLKQDWKKQEQNLPRLTYDEIYKMLWKKSSSIVKWIFVISILELFLSTMLLILFADQAYWEEMDRLDLKDFTIGVYIFSYSVTFFFIYLFYRNYQTISTTDDASTLINNILRTRRTVKFYIAYVLISSGLSAMIIAFFTIKDHRITAKAEEITKYSFDSLDWAKFILAGCIILTIFLGAIWLFYRLIYGILLKKLKRNYKELKKLEM